MFCGKCGAELEEGTLFCGSCGSKVEADTTSGSKTVQANNAQPKMDGKEQKGQNNQSKDIPTGSVPSQGTPNSNNTSQGVVRRDVPNNGGYGAPNKKGMPPKYLILVCCGAFIVIIAIVILFFYIKGSSKEEINLNDYCKVKFEGYDTEGTADLIFNQDKFQKDVFELEGGDEEEVDSLEDLWSSVEEYKVVQELENTYSVSLDKTGNLKNGDKVHIKFDIDEEAAEDLGYTLIGETKEIKVEGLTSIKEIDPFESVEVKFNGTSPDVSVDVINNSKDEFVRSLNFTCDDSYSVKKGDKVTVSVNCEENYALSLGYRLTKTSQTYECKDVDYYANQITDLNDKNLKGILDQSKNVLVAYFAQYSTYIKAGEFKYEGCYLLSLKGDNISFGNNNKVIALYSAEVTSLEKKFKPTKVYFPVESNNVIIKTDGTVEVDHLPSNEFDILGESGLDFFCFKVHGYTDVKKLYEGVITGNIGEYDYAMTDSLKTLHGEK